VVPVSAVDSLGSPSWCVQLSYIPYRWDFHPEPTGVTTVSSASVTSHLGFHSSFADFTFLPYRSPPSIPPTLSQNDPIYHSPLVVSACQQPIAHSSCRDFDVISW
jgi:hypothetical protein